jgi:FtsH-binding integral membrane protein
MNPWFNRFVPIHPAGWIVYIAALGILVWDFQAIQRTANSVGDMAFNFFPHVAGVFLLVAVIMKANDTKTK